MSSTIDVTIDVAGFYYSSDSGGRGPLTLPSGTTVLEAMAACRDRDMTLHSARLATTPLLDFSVEMGPSPGLFINEIVVLHKDEALSRQTVGAAPGTARRYESGRYAYADDPVVLDSSIPRLVRGDDSALPYVLAWQYYLYDAEGRDLARASGTPRRVEPASTKVLTASVTIVWRLIAIMLKPSELPGAKRLLAAATAAPAA